MDELKQLETDILKWHLSKGLKTLENQSENDKKWTFKTVIDSEYKRKQLRVISVIEGIAEQVFYADEVDFKKIIEKAKIFFND